MRSDPHSVANDRPDPAESARLKGHDRRHIHNQTHPHQEHHGTPRADAEPRCPRSEGRRAAAASAFTVHHAGRQVRIGPVAFWTVVGTLVIMAGWSLTTATYFAFQDDVITR